MTSTIDNGPANRTALVAIFRDHNRAREAVRSLKQAGFRDEHLGVLARGDLENESAADRATDSKVAEGAAIGAATGAGVGALWALGIAAGMLPAIGPVVAGGMLMSVLASAGGGATVGTLVGALVGLGIPEDEASYYEDELKGGAALVTVQAPGRLGEAWDIIRRSGGSTRTAEDTYHRAATATHAAAIPTHPAGART
jgi:hypothetical protein